MGYSVFPAPASGSKTRYITTLTSGTSWTVPAGVTYVNVLLVGGGASAGGTQGTNYWTGTRAQPGQTIRSIVETTPGSSISYSIGAGGGGNPIYSGTGGNAGGTTTFTGAASAAGGTVMAGAGTMSFANNGAVYTSGGYYDSAPAGGNGWIEIEYWV